MIVAGFRLSVAGWERPLFYGFNLIRWEIHRLCR
jgi:hypothetical protein